MEQAKDGYQLSYLRLDNAADASEQEQQHQQQYSSPVKGGFLQSLARRLWEANWTLEILGCLTSIAFFIAIIVVLLHYDGRAMPQWPYGITLNALVSILTTVMKATMAFILAESLAQLKWSWFRDGSMLSDLTLLDAASRGFMGAFIVLFRFLPRHLVTFGCLVLVVVAVTEPFVQQVIGISMHPVHAPGQSSIQVCNAGTYSDYGEGGGPGQNLVPLGTTGAIYSGIYQDQSLSSNAILASCPTGNCTFAPYQSFEICSRCANITHSLQLHRSPLDIARYTYHYELPNGLSFTTAESRMYLMNATTGLDFIELDTANLPLILKFTAISSARHAITQISATECALYFCIEEHEAVVREGEFSETRTSISATYNASTSWMSATKNTTMIPDVCYVNGTRYEKPYTNITDECVYGIDWLSPLALSNSLDPLLNGQGMLLNSYRPVWVPDTIRAIYGMQGNYTHIASLFESLASSLTLHARSKVCDATVTGVTWTVESFVHVRWPWMVLPGVLVVFSTVFLAITILHTRNQYIWKSSPLPLLFSDVVVDAPVVFKSYPTLKEMEDTVRKVDALLETSVDGITFKAVPR